MSNVNTTIMDGLKDWLLRGNPFTDDGAATTLDAKRAYKMRRSFTDLLPWLWPVKYKGNHYILLDDGQSVGATLMVDTVPTEGKDDVILEGIRDTLQRIFSETMAEEQSSPWTVQIFGFRDEAVTKKYVDEVRAYARKRMEKRHQKLPAFSEHYLSDILAPHLRDLSVEEGLFHDPLTGSRWMGCRRQVVICFYRKHGGKTRLKKRQTPVMEAHEQLGKLQSALKSAGLNSHTMQAAQFHDWLFRWFHPAPALTHGDTEAYLDRCAFPGGDRPVDWMMADAVCTDDIRSDGESGFWYFDGKPHSVLTVGRLRSAPSIGQVSGERSIGKDLKYACLDALPASSKFVITLVIQAQNQTEAYLDKLEKSSKGATAEARLTQENIVKARHNMVRSNSVYPYQIAVYLKAETEEELEEIQVEVIGHLESNNMQVLSPDLDDLQLDAYIRHLPMAYKPELDQCKVRRGLIYAQHAANLVPIFGRAQGSGNPGLLFFNRGGETLAADPLSTDDREKNGHLFLFGPTGAGKSATLVYTVMHMMAMYLPRVIIIEAGNSFGLLTQYFKKHGLKTDDIVLRSNCGTSLPPFKLALGLVDEKGNTLNTEDDTSENPRDILGELTIIATLMVTGGEEGETLSRPKVSLLQEALLLAAQTSRREGKEDVLTSDVIKALEYFAEKRPEQAASIQEMADAMRIYTRGFAGELFDRPGEEWTGEADFTRIELGTLANEGQNDKLIIAYVGLINAVLTMVEREHRAGRPTLLITDEVHIILQSTYMSAYLVLYIKLLGRRLGMWFWMATQNMADFKGDAKKMLAMFEWWLCLKMTKTEVNELEQYKELEPAERAMMLDCRKAKGLYTEGYISSDKIQGLFRNVPPAIALALAMTEQEEKAERQALMDEQGITEIEAAEQVAENLAEARRKRESDHA